MVETLIPGGTGFIGYHLARRLLQDPSRRLTLVDDFSRSSRDADLVDLLRDPRVRLLEADLTDPGALRTLPREWDEVYMLAAVVGVGRTMRDPARVIRVNTLAVLNLLDWLAPGRGILFLASTSESYAGGVNLGHVPVPTPETVPLTIDDITNPRFAYAASKILAEAAVLHGAAAKQIRFVIGRFHNVYGPRMGTEHVVPELCLRAIQREDPFRLFGAAQRRAFCHVDDAVEAAVRLVATPAAWGRIVNVGNDTEETAILELAELVLSVAGHRPRIQTLPAPAGSVGRRCPDLTLLRGLCGWSPTVTLDEGVRGVFEWYRAEGAAA